MDFSNFKMESNNIARKRDNGNWSDQSQEVILIVLEIFKRYLMEHQ
jgi:hypothetical protein